MNKILNSILLSCVSRTIYTLASESSCASLLVKLYFKNDQCIHYLLGIGVIETDSHGTSILF